MGAPPGRSPKRLTWTSGASSSPAIAIDSKKGLHVIWYDDTPGNQEIYYRRSTDGGANWDALKRLTWTLSSSYYTAIAIDANDAIHISWTDNTSGSYQIYYRKSTDRGSSWGEIQRLTWTSGASFGPAIAVDSKNHIHLVCEDYYNGGRRHLLHEKHKRRRNLEPPQKAHLDIRPVRQPGCGGRCGQLRPRRLGGFRIGRRRDLLQKEPGWGGDMEC